MSKLHVEVTAVKSGNENRLYGVLGTLATLIVIGLVGWGILKLLQAILPTLGLIALGIWGAWQVYILKKGRFLANRDKAGLPMSLRDWYYYNSIKDKDAETEPPSDEAVTVTIYLIIILVAVLLLMSRATQLMLVLAYATNDAYQIMPADVLGLALSVNAFARLFMLLPQTVDAFGKSDKPMEDETWKAFIWSKFTALVTIAYVVSIFLIVFGVIGK